MKVKISTERTIWQKMQPKDLIACIVIIGAFALKFSGADGTVSIIMAGIVAYYFARRESVNKDVK